MICQYCKREAELVIGKVIYPHLPKLCLAKFYRCIPCDARVGCHPGTATPLGSLANAELRLARTTAHRCFDYLWKTKRWGTRSEAYDRLAKELGIPKEGCHIGQFNIQQCNKVLEVCDR